ncbi:doublecortin domain-containing protein 2C-like [Salvelinus fontinalis]|uniref:doublecortin domain-containing protein 2C-like n=1 Tax=Salvelinus fontinalis TaxID=8038 RepID=UPI002484FA00|nr:doublecortin domain-containing protein 2C-like [Salvelinus fontinalis]XP_055720215.1 doublecortin domain-containing protein 2C-like [Salvelinus fontinalis]
MVYMNGDSYSGRRFVVNHRQVATMEAFLNDVTHCIQAPLAVRTLYTPVRVRELHDLQTGAKIYPGIRRLSRRYEGRKAARGPEDRYRDSALLDSPESDGG